MVKIKIENLQEEIKKIINLGYGETINLKFNNENIPNYNLLRFLIPTTDNLKYLNKYPIELKINGEFYEVIFLKGEKKNG